MLAAGRHHADAGNARDRRRQALLDNVEDEDVTYPQQPMQPPEPAGFQPVEQSQTDPPPVDPRARTPLDPQGGIQNGNAPPQQPSTMRGAESAAGWGADAAVDDGWGASQSDEEPSTSSAWGGSWGGVSSGPRNSARAFARSVLGAFVGKGGEEPAIGPKADVVPLTEEEEVLFAESMCNAQMC